MFFINMLLEPKNKKAICSAAIAKVQPVFQCFFFPAEFGRLIHIFSASDKNRFGNLRNKRDNAYGAFRIKRKACLKYFAQTPFSSCFFFVENVAEYRYHVRSNTSQIAFETQ